MVQVGVRFLRELVLGQKREHVDVRQLVVLRLLDSARDDAAGVVDEPVDEQLVECLLHLDKHRLTGLRGAVDVEDGGLVMVRFGKLSDLMTGEDDNGKAGMTPE